MNWELCVSHSLLSGAVLALAGDTADNDKTCQCSYSLLSGAVLALAGDTADTDETC